MIDQLDPTAQPAAAQDPTVVPRGLIRRAEDEVTPPPNISAHVEEWVQRIRAAKAHQKIAPAFRRMREDSDFVWGLQWPDQVESDDRYIANIVHRHIKTRTDALYARKPKIYADAKERMEYLVWDGTAEQAMQAMTAVEQAALMGMPPPNEAAMIMMDVQEATKRKQMHSKIGKTLVALCNHYISEQTPSFKKQMKQMVRRALTTSVGYIKIGFQREMQPSPEIESKIADSRYQLDRIKSMMADMQDGKVDPGSSALAQELEISIQSMQQQKMMLVREGVTFSFPRSTAVIPDPLTTVQLDGFVGTKWVVEEFLLSPDDVKDIYDVDVSTSYLRHNDAGLAQQNVSRLTQSYADMDRNPMVMVYEVYDKATGTVFTLADGYPNYLRAPEAPFVQVDQFFPYFTLVLNQVENEKQMYPKSDVRMLRSMQIELNRSKEGLRQHRIANRPLYASPAGSFEEEEEVSLGAHPPHFVIQLKNLAEGRPVSDLLQPVQKVPIDPNVYDTSHLFQDILRTVGTQEASLGGTSGATATETSIAEAGRMSTIDSNVDDMDETLSDLARATGQLCLLTLQEETVKEIVGPGAAWPQLSREQVMSEVFLAVKAGSSGRPNKEQRAARLERIAPILLQVPGIKPRWLAEKAIEIFDEEIDIDDAVADGLPSIIASNAMARGAMQPSTGDPATDPNQQGAEGGSNAPQGPGMEGGPQPAFPAPSAGS